MCTAWATPPWATTRRSGRNDVRCPRCGGYLTREIYYERGLDAGTTAVEFARCWDCGSYWPRPRLQVIVTAAEIAEGLTYRGGSRAGSRRPCSVMGCKESTNGNKTLNEHGWCTRHHWQWQNHISGRGSKLPPLLPMGDGRWVESPHYQRRAPRGSGRVRPSHPKRTCPLCQRPNLTMVDRKGPHGGICDRCRRQSTKAKPSSHWRIA